METIVQIAPVDSKERVVDATSVLTLAFCDDPVTRWLYPRPSQVLDAFPRLVDAFSISAFEHGTARISWDSSAAAIWLPPGLHVDDEAMGVVAREDFDESVRVEAEEFFGQADEYHPKSEHWYLPLIGVDPALRGTGLGSALLAEGLERCDAEHSIAYLESTNIKNIPLYERYGFKRIGSIQVGSSPEMVPMIREAR